MKSPYFGFRYIQTALRFDRRIQFLLQIIFDAVAIFFAISLAMILRLESTNFLENPAFYKNYVLILVPTLLTLAKVGLYRSFIRYISSEIAVQVAICSTISAVFVMLTKLNLSIFTPWSVSVIYATILFVVITGSRFTLRVIIQSKRKKVTKNVAIYGAGNAGAQLLRSIVSSPDYRVKIIIDDNPRLQGKQLYGHQVISLQRALENINLMDLDIILLAIPNASVGKRKKIISKLNNFNIEIKTIPAVADLIDGSARINEFKDILIEDLLGRDPVDPLPELMGNNITSKSVLVTGSGGSIGCELCRQIITLKPKQLILFDVSEVAIYKIFNEIQKKAKQHNITLLPYIGSILDRSLISNLFNRYKIDTVFHAAAYKHVPLMEINIVQAITNNVLGTLVLADEAVSAKVSNFTLISSDKAVNPTNVMGASKRLAERICQALNLEQSETKFSMVRFGNVLGSSGSVVPLFRKQIKAGGPITLTNPNIMRYFMTISEAVQLVIQANSMAKGGEMFVLDMGIPMKIKDLAFKMIEFSGLRPYLEGVDEEVEDGIAVRIVGLRPGEKMYEELSYSKNQIGTLHPRIMTVNEQAVSPKDMRTILKKLKSLTESQDSDELIKCLIETTEYKPYKKDTVLEDNASAIKNVLQNDKIVTLPIKK